MMKHKTKVIMMIVETAVELSTFKDRRGTQFIREQELESQSNWTSLRQLFWFKTVMNPSITPTFPGLSQVFLPMFNAIIWLSSVTSSSINLSGVTLTSRLLTTSIPNLKLTGEWTMECSLLKLCGTYSYSRLLFGMIKAFLHYLIPKPNLRQEADLPNIFWTFLFQTWARALAWLWGGGIQGDLHWGHHHHRHRGLVRRTLVV